MLPSVHKAQATPETKHGGTVHTVHTHELSAQQVEAGEEKVRDHPWAQSTWKAA